jgi:response regulator of citrate/malate metabolism
MAQDDVDRVIGTMRSTRTVLPKGLTQPTADLVERALRSIPGDLSAAECAEIAGLSRVSTRRYLEHFVATGRAVVRLRYGVAGRPERRYRWTSA